VPDRPQLTGFRPGCVRPIRYTLADPLLRALRSADYALAIAAGAARDGRRRAGRAPARAASFGASALAGDDLDLGRILVVGDDPDILALVRITLESCGHEVQTAPDGEAGPAAARDHQPTSSLRNGRCRA
jgi:PleD family two-component response regulator